MIRFHVANDSGGPFSFDVEPLAAGLPGLDTGDKLVVELDHEATAEFELTIYKDHVSRWPVGDIANSLLPSEITLNGRVVGGFRSK